mgnify:FL=1
MCDVWRELYESEKAERRTLQDMIYRRFGVTWDQSSGESKTFDPIKTYQRPSSVLHDVEKKIKSDVYSRIQDELKAGVLNPPVESVR